MLLLIVSKWCICVLCSILTYMKHICILTELPNISILLLYKHTDITEKKNHPSTNSPKSFWDWVTNIPFRKCVFILIRLHHTRTTDTIHLGRLAAKNTAFINPIKSGLIQTVAFTAISITCYLLVPNTPHDVTCHFPMATHFGYCQLNFWTKLANLSFPRCHTQARMHNILSCVLPLNSTARTWNIRMDQ